MEAEAKDLAGRLRAFHKFAIDYEWIEPSSEFDATLTEAEAEIEKLGAALEELDQWTHAYPVDVFPEPDLKRAAVVLKDAGMTLDAISASNFRHVLKRVGEIVRAVLHPDAPTRSETP